MEVKEEKQVGAFRAQTRLAWLKHLQQNQLAYYLVLPAFLFMVLIHFVPMVQGIWMSFLKLNQFTLNKFLSAPFVGLKNYKDILFEPQNPLHAGLIFAVRNTAIYTVIVTFLVMFLGIAVALLLNRNFKGRGIARTAMLLPWIVPSYVVGILWGFMWQKDNGVINYLLVNVFHILDEKPFWLLGHNTLIAIIIPTIWRSWPFLMVVFLAALQVIPDEIYEAAKIDGASAWKRFWHVTFPLLKPVIAIQMLFQLIANVYSYNIVATMFGNGAGYPGEWGDLLLTLLSRQSFSYWMFGPGAAASVLLMVSMLIVVGIWYRSFKSELMIQ